MMMIEKNENKNNNNNNNNNYYYYYNNSNNNNNKEKQMPGPCIFFLLAFLSNLDSWGHCHDNGRAQSWSIRNVFST